jgi:hypothetical protein
MSGMATIPNSPPIDAFTDNARLGAELVAGFAEVDAVLVGAVLVGAVLVGTLGLPDEVALAGVDTVELPDALEPELTGGEALTVTLEPELVLDKINTRLAIVDNAFNCCGILGSTTGCYMTMDAKAAAATLPYDTESREGQQQESLKGGRAHRYGVGRCRKY